MKPLLPPFCLWEEYQRTGEYRDMTRWLKHRAYCRAVVLPEDGMRLLILKWMRMI